ncbi:MAG: CocE/NonD family hydrolase [Gammaproteobacteria bacterium]
MDISDIKIVHEFPRVVREIENTLIPLSDGVQLAARIWLPEDAEEHPVPAVLEFLPYRKRDGTSERDALTHPYVAGHGYACVRVDMRGSGESEGVLLGEYLQSEQDDAIEVLDWIASQPWCSGETGMIGISWGGFNGLQVAARRPASLKAIVTIASTDDRYSDDIHYMGGVMLNDNLAWSAYMFAHNSQPPDPVLVGERWRDIWIERLRANDPWFLSWIPHQRRDGFWQHGSVCERYEDIECAVYAVGGWADAYSNAVPRLLANLKCPTKGLVGPWAHKYPHFGKPGPRIGFLQETLRWWDHWLKGKNTGIMEEPEYRVWMQQSIKPLPFYDQRPGRWVSEPSWPSPRIQTRTFFLNLGGLDETPEPGSYIEIRTPQHLGVRQGEWFSFGFVADGPADQREDDGASVVFDTEPLPDTLEILGAPVLHIRVSADKPNAFIAARLNDVAPDGASTRVSYGVLNLTHRESHEDPEPLIEGQTYDIRLQLNDVAHAFSSGHKIRVSLSNTLWPLLWPSPEPVSIMVESGSSSLSLPMRIDKTGDDALSDFPPPEAARPQPAESLKAGQFSRTCERDEVNGITRYSVVIDSGMERLTDNGWEHGAISRESFEIRDDDPNSNKATVHWTSRCDRPDIGLRSRTETYSSLSSSSTEFFFTASIEAFENDQQIFSKEWEERFPRDLN